MSAGSLSRRYAKALMELGEEQSNFEQLGNELRGLAKAMHSSAELTSTLTNPLFPRDDRRKLLEAILGRLGASVTVKNFSMLLLDRERMSAVEGISRELDAMIDEKLSRVTAEVTSASVLTPQQEQEIRQQLEKLSGKKVDMKTANDPELLGGVVAKVGDVVYDGSLRTQLQQIRAQLAG